MSLRKLWWLYGFLVFVLACTLLMTWSFMHLRRAQRECRSYGAQTTLLIGWRMEPLCGFGKHWIPLQDLPNQGTPIIQIQA